MAARAGGGPQAARAGAGGASDRSVGAGARGGSEAPSQEEQKEKHYDEAMANVEREMAEDAEWKRIQENTFTRWTNEHLRQAGTSINDLETDFSNGLKLIALLEVLSGKKMPRHNKKPTFRSQKLENVSIALNFLETEGVTLVNIDSTDITDCKLKLIMGLIWTLILHYSISMPMYDGPELGGHVEDKTPKQRLLGWMQNKVPGVPINNFTSDWQDGIKVGALVDSVAPGLCPDWDDWDPAENIRNATEAMDLADNWLGVPKLLTPEEIVNPNVDEQSMMTYLSQFPNAKVKENAPLRAKAVASKVRAHGPGLEATGVVAKAPAKFTVETFGAGDGELNITVKGPGDTDYKVDRSYNNDRKKSWACSYFPDKEGDFVVNITFAGRKIPNAPYNVNVEGFAGDANKVRVAGPGIEPEGVVANKQTTFDIFTEGAGKGKPEVIVLDPHGLKDAIPVRITPHGNDTYTCDYTPAQLGVHSVNVFFAGNPIPDSPFGVKVGPASSPSKVWASGRGLQPHGLRTQETVDFKVFTEGAGEGAASVKIIGPGGVITPTTRRNVDPNTIEFKYTPERDGRYIVMITWGGKEIPKSPFEVKVGPHKTSKIKAYGPGLTGGVVDMPALFTVDTCGETGALGFSIEGPSQAKINCKDNGDGSADVDYTPTSPGEYAVHILCDNDDIPGSPYMAQILPKSDYNPSKVLCYGPGVETNQVPNVETHFTIDTTKAGKAPLDILFMDDYGEMRPLWKDENGLRDPQNGGIMAIKLIKAKELVKGDLVGKSDPYAVIRHGSQKFTTKVVRNSQDPQWDFEAQVTIPDQGDTEITVELFDKDKIGKDKSLGLLAFDASQMVSQKVIEQGWYPLTGVKSGQVLLSADFVSDTTPSMARDIYKSAAQPERKFSHKNLEVNRPLLEKKSEGIYICTYTPRKTQKQVIWVNYGGVGVPGSPFRITVDDPTDPSKVKVYGKGLEDGNKTGQMVDFTIDCKDAGPGDLAVDISDDKEREVSCKVKDNGDHTFKAEYKPLKNGTHAICIKYDGREIPQSPINVSIKTDIDTRKIKVKGLDDEVFVDCTNEFDVDTSGLPTDVTPNIACTIKAPNGSSLPSLKVDKPSSDGNVRVSYTPTQEGKHDISVTCDGSPIQGSPFKVTAKKGSDPSKVIAYGPGLEKGIVNEPNQFTIETRNAGTGGLGLAIEGPAEAKMTCKDNRDGSCTVDYVPVVDGNYDISVKYDDRDIPGSPFSVPVEYAAGSSRKSSRSGQGMNELPEGRLHINLIKAKELIKADKIGKSDPYAVVQYGKQKFKTPTVKNTLEPKWDYEMDFDIPEDDLTEVNIEVFDSDKIGKDKSLGDVNIEIAELLSAASSEGRWYDLTGTKSGQVLLSADLLDIVRKTSSATLGSSVRPLGDRSGDNGSMLPTHGKLPPGKACVNLIRAKELVKKDLVGKSDPYALLKYGSQQEKTPTQKNTQEPRWEHKAIFDVPEGEKRKVSIEVMDSDKLGKDKSLGKVEVDLAELVNNESQGGKWYPLSGAKAGQVLLSADFLEDGKYNPADPMGSFADLRNKSGKGAEGLKAGLVGGDGADNGIPVGKAKLHVIKAKDLTRTDMIGKSDPYAVVKYGRQQDKTKVVKNTQEPKWDHRTEFNVPDENSRIFNIEVFDSDKLGKDKSLGKLDLDLIDILKMDGQEGQWFPLSGGKKGQILLAADFADELGRNAGDILAALLGQNSEDPRDTLANANRSKQPSGSENDGSMIGPDGRKVSGDPYGSRKGSTDPYGSRKGSRDTDGGRGGDGDPDAARRRSIDPHGRRKASNDPDSMHGLLPDGSFPEGTAVISVVKARGLDKADIIGKSDPYAVLVYGRQQQKTPVIKNSLEPQWDFTAEFKIPDEGDEIINLEVFDSDKIGKDKSLGSLNLPLVDVLAMDGQEGRWFPLTGSKKGEVLLMADFVDEHGNDSRGNPSALANEGLIDKARRGSENPNGSRDADGGRKGSTDPYGSRKESSDPLGSRKDSTDPYGSRKGSRDTDGGRGGSGDPDAARRGSTDPHGRHKASNDPDSMHGLLPDGGFPEGTAVISVVKARGLDKADIIGKSDPYAVLVYGKQQQKSPVIKNTLEPKWDFTAEFKIPDEYEDAIKLEVFDSDKIGKDKSLGSLNLPLVDVLAMDGQDGRWFPLAGSKKGEVLLMADFVDENGNDSRGNPSTLANDGLTDKARKGSENPNGSKNTDGGRKGSTDPYGSRKESSNPLASRKGSTDPDGSRKGSRDTDGGRGGSADPDAARRGSTDPQGRRKASNDPDSMHGLLPDGGFPEGTAVISVVKARGLDKADFIGKSDPYAVLEYGKQKQKSQVVKNTLEPKWDFTAEFKIPDENNETIHLEVFDSDKIGKDKSLGDLNLPLADVLAMDGQDGRWFPLVGSKKGEVLLMANFVDQNGNDSRGNPSALSNEGLTDSARRGSSNPSGSRDGERGQKESSDPYGSRKGSRDANETLGSRKGSTDPYGSRKGSRDTDDGRGGSGDPDAARRGSTDPHGRRKASNDPDSMHGLLPDGTFPVGTAVISVVKARGLDKADMIGKSDPYAVLVYGKQQQKSPVIKNTLEPQWDFTAEFKIPDEDDETIYLEVFDSDKIGKDKSLGSLNLPLIDVLAMDGQDGRWFPLVGSKKGEVLLMADFVDENGNDSRGNPSALANEELTDKARRGSENPNGSKITDGGHKSPDPYGSRKESSDPLGSRKGSTDPYGSRKGSRDTDVGRGGSGDPDAAKRGSTDPHGRRKASNDPDSMHGLLPDGSFPEGTAVISVVKARGLDKADIIGKSDPYAVLVYGKQQQKSPVKKNTLEPQWDFTAEFKIPDEDDETIYLEVFDSDKIGKDKSLGSLNLPLVDVLAMDGQDGRWFPLSGSKKGEVLLLADFMDENGKDSRGNPSALANEGLMDKARRDSENPNISKNTDGGRKGSTDPYGSRKESSDPLGSRKGSTDPYGSRKGSRDPDGGRGGSGDPDAARRVSTDPHRSRKASNDPHSMHGLMPDGSFPEGTAIIAVVKARGLDKADMIGKSDPYAVLVYGKQQQKSPVMKNTLEPQWDFTAEFKIPDEDDETIYLEVFDSDKIGKDKTLGSLNLPLVDVLAMDGQDGRWFPLSGSKKGEVLLMADFVDENGNDSRGNPSALANEVLMDKARQGSEKPNGAKNADGGRKGSTDPYGSRKESSDPLGSRKGSTDPYGSRKGSRDTDGGRGGSGDPDAARRGSTDPHGRRKGSNDPDSMHGLLPDGSFPEGTAVISVVKARGLDKADMIGKSDPYAVLVYGKQQQKSPVMKNTLEPQWDFTAEFKIPDEDDETIYLEVFDSDKIGKDKSLGSLNLPLVDVLAMDGQDGRWFPLSGSKKGEVLMTADFVDENGNDSRGNPSSLATDGLADDLRRGSDNPNRLRDVDREGKRSIDPLRSKKNSIDPYGSRKGSTESVGSRKGSSDLDANNARRESEGGRGGLSDPNGVRRGSTDPNGRRKASNDPKSMHGLLQDGNFPEGTAIISVVKAKGLDKADIIGKSDPYAVLVYGKQQQKSLVIKNTLEPVWDFTAEFKIPDEDNETIKLEIFDSDKIGKDKGLGNLNLPLVDILAMDGQDGRWFSLAGSKKGEVLLMADFVDENGNDSRGNPSALVNPMSRDRLTKDGPKTSQSGNQGLCNGRALISLIKAKDLIKTDIVGKSDPYALVRHGSQEYKTPTVKNNQEPQWDAEIEFEVPDGNDSQIHIEIFDEDTVGKDKSMGTLDINLDELANMSPEEGYWFPLEGVKSGQILLTGEVIEGLGDIQDTEGADLGSGLTRPSQRGSVSDDNANRAGPGAGVRGVPAGFEDQLPEGEININLVKAKDLIKSDVMGKSDPYAVLKYGDQKHKTSTEKNTQNPQWNYNAKFNIPDGSENSISLEIFDSNKLGKDKSLGKINLDLDVLSNDGGLKPQWLALEGVKSGQILLSSDFAPGGDGSLRRPDGGLSDADKAADKANKKKLALDMLRLGAIPEGKACINLVKAKDLENADKKGKSDPYAVLKFGKQKSKTNTVRNTQNPHWDFGTEFDVPDGEDTDINIEVFDDDKLGRDKSLGTLALGLENILRVPEGEGVWFPLDGVKSGQLLIEADFLPEGLEDGRVGSISGQPVMGGKGSGQADPAKVRAYGPGLEEGKVMPGRPASFTVDSSKTGPAPLTVDMDSGPGGRKPTISQTGSGKHEVTYVPPPVGQPYQVSVKYGGEDIPGSPFNMSSNPDLDDVTAGLSEQKQNNKKSLQDRKGSKIGVSVNPDAENLGKVHVGLIAAKDLMKSDIMGKSDPYAILSHGNQKFRTNTVKNSQNPEWNYDADFNVPDGGDNTIKVNIFDADKVGKDKPLGLVVLPLNDVMSAGMIPPAWYPLVGAKSGQVLMSADFEDLSGRHLTNPERALQEGGKDLLGSKAGQGVDGLGKILRQGSRDQLGSGIGGEGLPEGALHVDLLGARNLAKSDLIGKSDPYAVLRLGNQEFKTDAVKNSQNPDWNFGADFDIDWQTPESLQLIVFDKDKIGKDKPLGSALISVVDLLAQANTGPNSGTWIPLTGARSGEVLVSTNFQPTDEEDFARRMSGHGRGLSRTNTEDNEGRVGIDGRKGSGSDGRIGSGSEGSRKGSREGDLTGLRNKGSSGSLLGDGVSEQPDHRKGLGLEGSRKGSGSDGGLRGSREGGLAGLRNKGSSGSLLGDDNGTIPDGNVHVNLKQARDLPKLDIMGKSDPYAIIACGDDKSKTKTVKNNQNPEFDHDAYFPIQKDGADKISIDLFDADKFGKDKPIGSVDLDIADLLTSGPMEDVWLPLGNGKGGQVQLSADFQPAFQEEDGSINIKKPGLASGRGGQGLHDKLKDGGRGRVSGSDSSHLEPGSLHMSLIQAKDLIKADLIGKSDPYAVISFDNESLKTKTVKNNQNPEWNFEADIPVGSDGPRLVNIDVFDSDKFGKDKCLGSAQLDVADIQAGNTLELDWIPLAGTKSGKIQVSSDFTPTGEAALGKSRVLDRMGSARDEERRGERRDSDLSPRKGSGLRSGGQSPEYDDDYESLGDGRESGPGSRKSSDELGGPVPEGGRRTGGGAMGLKDRLGSKGQISVLGYPEDNLAGRDGRHGSVSGDGRHGSVSGDGSRRSSGSDGGRRGSDGSGRPGVKLSGSSPLQRMGSSLGPAPEEGDDGSLGNLHLEILQAKDLVKADIIGKSDPYAVVTYGDDKIKTKTVKNNQNPEWNFMADIPIDPNGPSTLQIEVFDKDKLGKDKPLGAAEIDIPSLMNNTVLREAWVPLDGVKSGKIQVSADFTPQDELDHGVGSERPGGRREDDDSDSGAKPNARKPSDNTVAPGNIHLSLVQARDLVKTDLIGKSDPYAVVTYGNDKIMTKTVKNDQNPEWNFEADIPYDPNYSDTLKIEVFDKDRLGKDKLIGTSTLDLPNLATGRPLDEVWIPLKGVKPGKSGELQLSAEYTPDTSSGLYENVQPGKDGSGPRRESGALGAPRSANSPESDKLGTIKLDLLCAKDLISSDVVGASDPYAIITHGSQKYKTDILKNTQNPEWNIQCEVEVPDGHDRNISIDIYDADKFGKDTHLGSMNLDIAKVMNLGQMEQDWHPLEGVGQGQICVGADFVPDYGSSRKTSSLSRTDSASILINQRFVETRRSSSQFHEVSLNRIPLPATGGVIEASIRTPSGKVDIPEVQDDNSGTVAVKYQPTDEGMHYLDVKYNGDQVQGSPFKFHVAGQNNGKAVAYGPGLTHGVCGELANFTISTKKAGAGGLNLAVEGPSKAEINCLDNKDGTVNVNYLPTAPGEYKITAKFADEHIPGSPFTCKITGEGQKRNQISVGSNSELQLPGNLTESDLRSLKAFIESPSGGVEQCFLKKLPRGNIGISFTPREVGEHLVSVQRKGKHITNSPFKITVNSQEVGDAARVQVGGEGLQQGKTHMNNQFKINTKTAGYGGLSLSIEGPSKAEIDCKDNDDGTLDVDYRPTEPGFYIINIKFADAHVPGSPFQVPISGEGSEKLTENIKRMREAVPVTEVGSQCRLTFKMPGISIHDLNAMVTSPSGRSSQAGITELEEGLYAVNFVPQELGVHTVTVRYREMDIPGSPFQFTVGPLMDSGSHRVHAGGPGLERGVEAEAAEFNVWTREAGPGSLAISVEGPAKAQIDFKDRKDGSCYVSYIVEEPGEYSVGIRFNEEHIPGSPYKVCIIPRSESANKVKISNLDEDQLVLNAPQTFMLTKNGAPGSLDCKMVSPSGQVDDCFISTVGPDEYSVRFVPKEEGHHFLHAKLDGVHVPGSPFKVKVGGDGKKDGSVKVFGTGLDRVKTGEKASFVIDTSSVGAGTLSVTVDGPSKVDMDCNEVEKGYEVSYTPLIPGDYFVTVKYNGKNVDGSPFKVVVTGSAGGGVAGAKHTMQRRQSTTMMMETVEHTMIRQESSVFNQSSSAITSSRSNSRPIAIQPHFISDASAVTCAGPGLYRPTLGVQNAFTVDCNGAGNNVLFVGVYGPETPCDEVHVKHQGDGQYGISYKLTDRGQYILYVKWGEEHIPGSPFHIEV